MRGLWNGFEYEGGSASSTSTSSCDSWLYPESDADMAVAGRGGAS